MWDKLVKLTGMQGTQVALEVAPVALDDVPAGHEVQAEEPSEELYVPYKHIYGWSYWQR